MRAREHTRKKTKVLFYTMNWYPFEGSIQHIYAVVLRYLKSQGCEVTILTSIPYFLNGREERWETYRWKFFIMESWEDMKTVRTFVLSPYFMRVFRVAIRIVNCISFAVTSLFASLFIGKHDVILAVSHPPLLIGITSFIISRIKRCEYIYCLEDIYPDILVELNILKTGRLVSLLRKIELLIYNRAKTICVLSKQMKDNLIGKGMDGKKIELIPHFADLERIVPLSKRNPFAEEYGLEGKFVVLFSGSISYRYSVNTIFDSAKILSSSDQIEFVFVERGELKDILKQKVASQGLRNISFVPFQYTHRFPQLLASSDVCIVSLDSGFGSYSVPSKIYNIMASARAIIAMVDENSEVSRIVKRAECGVIVSSRSPALLAEEIQKLSYNKEKCTMMGRNGRTFVEGNFSKEDICKKYKEVIN